MRTRRVSVSLVIVAGSLVALWSIGASGSIDGEKAATAIHPETGELVVLTQPREGSSASGARGSEDGCVSIGTDPGLPIQEVSG